MTTATIKAQAATDAKTVKDPTTVTAAVIKTTVTAAAATLGLTSNADVSDYLQHYVTTINSITAPRATGSSASHGQ